jgi:DNA-binding NarL/FixJ family response regulator
MRPRRKSPLLISAGAYSLLATKTRIATLLSPHLSAAEIEIVCALVAGLSNADISRIRRTSVRTTANQVASILRKLRVGSRRALVVHIVHSISNCQGPTGDACKAAKLSSREHEVLLRAAAGQSNKVIANELELQPGTVGCLLARARQKLHSSAPPTEGPSLLLFGENANPPEREDCK